MDQNAVLGTPIQFSLSIPYSYYSLGFAGLVTAVAAWSIWGGDMFPAGNDPVGGSFSPVFFGYSASNNIDGQILTSGRIPN